MAIPDIRTGSLSIRKGLCLRSADQKVCLFSTVQTARTFPHGGNSIPVPASARNVARHNEHRLSNGRHSALIFARSEYVAHASEPDGCELMANSKTRASFIEPMLLLRTESLT